jgi:hypothetical protein
MQVRLRLFAVGGVGVMYVQYSSRKEETSIKSRREKERK